MMKRIICKIKEALPSIAIITLEHSEMTLLINDAEVETLCLRLEYSSSHGKI